MLRMYAKYRLAKGVSKNVSRDLTKLILFTSSLTVALCTLTAKAVITTCKILRYAVLNFYTIDCTYEE